MLTSAPCLNHVPNIVEYGTVGVLAACAAAFSLMSVVIAGLRAHWRHAGAWLVATVAFGWYAALVLDNFGQLAAALAAHLPRCAG